MKTQKLSRLVLALILSLMLCVSVVGAAAPQEATPTPTEAPAEPTATGTPSEASPTSTPEPSVTDTNEDGLTDDSSVESADEGFTSQQFSAPLAGASSLESSSISIGMVQTGGYSIPRNRLISLGYSVVLIPPTAGLATFQNYTIVYLPMQWAEGGLVGAYETIEARANDYRAYVSQGGGLFVEQPNPFRQPNERVTPTLLLYPITFYNRYNFPSDMPRIIDPNHSITQGLTSSEMPFPFDQMISVDPFYHKLVVGSATGYASLVVGEFGLGRVLVETANPSYHAFHVFSDEVYRRMIDWTAAAMPVREPVILLPGVTGTYLNNHNGEVWPNEVELFFSDDDEFLLPLRLDPTGTRPLYPNDPDYATVEAGEIILNIGPLDFYGHAIETLEEAGYQQGVDLFIFPYDWRLDIDTLADDLLVRIDEIREQTGAERVNIVAHSMGGLIARAVLANPNSIGKVRKVFTLGAPVLGAPKILGILEYRTPCFLDLLRCEPNEITTQDFLTNMIPTYQFLPGPAYHLAQIAPLNIDRDINGDGLPEGAQVYSEWTAIVNAHRNSLLMQKNEPFHQAYDNLSLADPSVQFYRVVGDETSTILQIREYIKCFIANFNCDVKHELIMGNGDGTVPLHSADLYNPDTGFDYRNGVTNYYAHEVKHAGLPGDKCVLNMILAFVENSPAGCAGASTSAIQIMSSENIATTISDTPEPFSGIELETLGPVQGIVQDEEGNLLSLSTDLDSNVIPSGVYNAIGDTQSFFLNQNGNYVAQLTVTGTEPIILRMRMYADDAMNAQAVFNVNAPIHSRLQIAFNTGDDLAGLLLQVDTNADGLFDEIISPDSYYTGSAASETIPPTTTMSLHWASPQVAEVTLKANDQPGGTGVADTYYRILDGSNPELTVYTSPFSIALGAELQFFSVDRVGNTEIIQAIQTVPLDIKPGDFPNSINTKSAGKTPAAILGTSAFNAASVDVPTITLAGAPVVVKPNGTSMVSFEDVNRDGFLDLVFHVSTSALQLDSSSTEAFLYARTQDGTLLIGVDALRIVN